MKYGSKQKDLGKKVTTFVGNKMRGWLKSVGWIKISIQIQQFRDI